MYVTVEVHVLFVLQGKGEMREREFLFQWYQFFDCWGGGLLVRQMNIENEEEIYQSGQYNVG